MHLLYSDQDPAFRKRLNAILRQFTGVRSIAEYETFAELLDALTGQASTDRLVVAATNGLQRGDIQRFVQDRPAVPLIVVGGNDPERMRAALGEGARGYVRRTDVGSELATAVAVVRDGGVYVPPVVGMRAGSEPLMTTAGPVPAGFFREDAGQTLTPRQREILAMIRAGHNNTDIADALALTVGTVKIHITAIFKALGVKNRTQAIVAAEWLDLPEVPRPKPAR